MTKANEAIEKIRRKQEQMMKEAEEMEIRAEQLQSIAECQNRGYQWQVGKVILTEDGMKAKKVELFCYESHVQIIADLVPPAPLLVDEKTELRDFLSDGDEEE
tara:strand:- start:1262 stop:1570 length:309 start_codon:yes stop_codon:yes gene_type:complete